MKYALTFLLLLTFFTPPASAADLQQQAKQQHRQALQQLRQGRQDIIKQRRQLSKKRQRAERRLQQLHASEKRLQAAVLSLQNQAHNLDLQGTQLQTQRQRLQALLGMAAAGPDTVTQRTWETTATAALQQKLQQLQKISRVSVQPLLVASRDGKHLTVPTLQLGTVQAIAIGKTGATQGLLRNLPHGPPAISGPALNSTSVLANGHDKAGGQILHATLDVSGQLAQQAVTSTSWLAWLQRGGKLTWLIIAVGVFGMALLGERLWYLRRNPLAAPETQRIINALQTHDIHSANQALQTAASNAIHRLLHAGLDCLKQPLPQRQAALEAALLTEEPRLERSMTLIGACAAVAPLMGLLGTVTGMISTFQTMTAASSNNAALLSGGISVALITTQLGLIVAVPLLLGHALTSRAIERRQAYLEEQHNLLLSLDPLPTNHGVTPC